MQFHVLLAGLSGTGVEDSSTLTIFELLLQLLGSLVWVDGVSERSGPISYLKKLGDLHGEFVKCLFWSQRF
jgi:hypothetical protein